MNDDPYDLHRFVEAQDSGGAYIQALAELRMGRKKTHWMWFVFPQIAGLGRSPMAKAYAISSVLEAEAYIGHPVLGARLVEASCAVRDVAGRTASEILGDTDAAKLRSSMTLFGRVAPDQSVFQQVLDKYFDGIGDHATESRL